MTTSSRAPRPDAGGTQAATEQRPVFVYGTLLAGEANHDYFLAGRTRSEVPATLTGAVLYDNGAFPYLALAPGSDAVVYGDLITIDPAVYDSVLAELDDLEGYIEGRPDNHYERVITQVTLADEVPAEAYVYVAGEALRAALPRQYPALTGGSWRRRYYTEPTPEHAQPMGNS